MKQRINVLLVPNKTLETPNYRLERLKHDDPRLDNIEASYKMAEQIEDPTTVTRRSQEKHNKQEPVIKGVLPDMPAPVVAQKLDIKPEAAPIAKVTPVPAPVQVAVPAGKGFFGWIKGLFGGAEAPAAAAAATTATDVKKDAGSIQAEAGSRGERTDRGERSGRDGRRGGRGRNERGDRPESRPEGRGEQRGEGRPEARNNERPQRNNEPRSPEQRNTEPRDEQRFGQRNEQRSEQRGEQRSEGQEQREPRPPREPREGGRAERPRRERGERTERSSEQRPPMDATEQDIALANKAAMAAAMGGPAPDAGQDSPRRERGERGRRNDRRTEPRAESREERQDFGDAAAEPITGLDVTAPEESPVQADRSDQGTQGDAADQQRPPREPRERRSRDRYGRERRERNDGTEGERAERQPNSFETPVFTENSVPNAASGQQIRAQEAPETVANGVQQVASVQSTPAAASTPVPAKAPAAAAPVTTALPKVASYDLPLQDLAQIAQGSGLQWVNSDASKIAEAQAAIALEAKPVHVPRERAPVVASNEGPLVLVETSRDLRDMPLPFEKPAA